MDFVGHLIMPDTRGHGLSGNPKGDYSVESRSADLAGLIGALGLDRPVIMGHSLGAETTLYTAANYPELVGGVILEDPLILLPGEPIYPGVVDYKKFMSPMVQTLTTFKILPGPQGEDLVRRMYQGWSDDELKPWIESKKRLNDDFLFSLKDIDFESTTFVIFERISCPALLIIGDKRKGSIISQEAASVAKKYLPGLKISHIKGASHNIRREQFDKYIKEVKDFLTAFTSPGDTYAPQPFTEE